MAQLLVQERRIGLTFWAGLLSQEVCHRLIAIGQSLMQPATVVDPHSGQLTPTPNACPTWPGQNGRITPSCSRSLRASPT
jgi:hypothetical protein